MSLRTRRYREAEHLAGIMDRAFREGLVSFGANGVTDAAKLNAVLRKYLQEQLDGDPEGGVPLWQYPLREIKVCLAEALGSLAERNPKNLNHIIDRLMETHEFPEAQRERVSLGVLEAEVALYRSAIRRANGEEASVFTEPAATSPICPVQGHTPQASEASEPQPGPSAAKAPKAPPAKPLASSLVEPFFAHRQAISGTTHQVIGQERDTLRVFLDVCGDRPIDGYQRGDISHFHATLRKLPANRGRSPKDKELPVAHFIARAEASGEPRLMDKTLKRHHSALSQLFKYALDHGHLANAQRTELCDNFTFKPGKGARTQRDAWTSEELKLLFASPVWTGCESFQKRSVRGPHVFRDAMFWLPLLALYHGARLEELADLYRRDVTREGDIWAIHIVETEGNPETGKRTLKTENATRVLAVHPELIRLGFLAYVEKIAPEPNDPLFPDLAAQGPDKKRGPRITRWFGHYRRLIRLFRHGVGMHAFRHTANTRLRDVIDGYQAERHVAYMLGHSPGGGEGRERYDKGPGLRAAAGTLALLAYPELDLSHLHVARP